MKKFSHLLLTIVLGANPLWVCAQNSGRTQSTRESFQAFRESLKNDYNSFRSRIAEHYADFLAGEWHPYEPLLSPEKNPVPKPSVQPSKEPQTNPAPVAPKGPAKQGRPAPTEPVPPVKTPDSPSRDSFEFYGFPVELKKVDFNILRKVDSPKETSAQWKALEKGNAAEVAGEIDRLASEMGLNGYLTFRLAEAYVNSKFPSASEGAKMSAVHYLMVRMGYDARLAMASNGIPLMLLPISQTVYGSMYLTFDGRHYTAFTAEGTPREKLNGVQIYTCTLPSGSASGREIDLKLNGLNIPKRMKPFDLSGGGLELTGEVNENLYRMLYRYPQMPTEDYAESVLDPALRQSLVRQVREQLGDKPDEEAVNSLLGFFHALPYATDEERHGFEKPYFLEETLYYDKCDCEDRAIMFTWLLWNALSIPNHLLAYPGHESASVSLRETPLHRAGYQWENSRYWIADPTYIGASVGEVMPVYSTTTPHIDLSFK